MAGKRKGKKKGRKGRKRRIDEFELRRELRKQRRPTVDKDMIQPELPEHPEEIRIAGIEG